MSRADVEIKTKDGACRTAGVSPGVRRGTVAAGDILYGRRRHSPYALRHVPAFGRFRLSGAAAGYVLSHCAAYEPFDGKTLFTDPVQRDKLGVPLVRSATNKQCWRAEDTESFLAYLDSHSPDITKGKKVGATGYCMGGGFRLMVAAAASLSPCFFSQVSGGGSLATDVFDSPHNKILDARSKRAERLSGLTRISTICQSVEARVKVALDAAIAPSPPEGGSAHCTVGRWRICRFTSATRPSGILMNCANVCLSRPPVVRPWVSPESMVRSLYPAVPIAQRESRSA